MRYYLVDRVTELAVGHRARGIKAVTLTDEVLHDHFPDYPVMPAALILESAAQLAGFLIEMSCNSPGEPVRRALLAQIQQAKFHNTVGPGDSLDLVVTLAGQIGTAVRIGAEAAVGTRKVMRGGLTFMLQTIESERVHEQRRYLYRLWTKDLANCPAIP